MTNAFNPDLSSSIAGKVVLVTGVSPGTLGAAFAEHIAKAHPKLIILAGRNIFKGQATADAIAKSSAGVQTRTLHLNLESLSATRAAAAEVNGWEDVPNVDVLVNNAGIMACDYAKTKDGFERQFATNHLGPFLFTNLIMGKILNSQGPRVVVVSSSGHRFSWIQFADVGFADGKLYNRWTAYGQSKTANVLLAVALAERLGERGLTAVSLHLDTLDKTMGNPEGWSGSVKLKDLAQGVATHVYGAFEPNLRENNGRYLLDNRIANPYVDTIRPWALDKVEADKLWKLSEKLVGEEFVY
ncbi:short-chain dehydrogenase [Coniophora puteana RWD-64-598 SS2]|uniref:Short-chain dehydrogenase n=1 Tax=Coniophora puteana (strain RWD-64-598) TaxID=741705 RepID=A0A5M3MIJ8_CONPW|nr:short-chain dehydrogenase [Coniophora puteana RWD-64-598 SS2]EIW78836.1 short-chain dehydrogenase [Coniophora puteana RWD-64-598 SS2]